MTGMRAILGSIVFLVGCAALLVMEEERRFAGRFLPGVWVEEVPLGGRTLLDARSRLQPGVRARLGRRVEVRVGSTQVAAVTAEELGLRHDLEGVLRRAYGTGRTGPVWERLRWRLRLGRAVYRIPYGIDRRAVDRWLARFARAVRTPPTDARFVVEGDRVRVLESRDGRSLDVERSRERLVRALLRGETTVDLAVRKVPPRLRTEEARAWGIEDVVAEFRTPLINIPSRTHNIALTARLLRGRLIRTGEVFSFNRAVGPRTRARGFLPAPVILRDEFVPGDGGGVCQVSSTLFNAALLADLTILSRTPHSMPVRYLPVGRDATVVYGAIDLRFRNDGPPLLLWADVRGRELVVRFYGRRVPARTVEIAVRDLERLPPPPGTLVRPDPDLPEGVVRTLPPRPGFRASTWRIVRQYGRIVRQELVAQSTYPPAPEIVKVGTGRADRPAIVAEERP